MPISIAHNFDPAKFKWLFAKYVRGFNPAQHCTNSLRGWYSKRFAEMKANGQRRMVFNERPDDDVKAVYICGVARQGYAKKENYPHNVHIAIELADTAHGTWMFENWKLEVKGGRLLSIPSQEELPSQYASLPEPYVTCRIFRWAAVYFTPGSG